MWMYWRPAASPSGEIGSRVLRRADRVSVAIAFRTQRVRNEPLLTLASAIRTAPPHRRKAGRFSCPRIDDPRHQIDPNDQRPSTAAAFHVLHRITKHT